MLTCSVSLRRLRRSEPFCPVNEANPAADRAVPFGRHRHRKASNSAVTADNIGLRNIGLPARILSSGHNTIERNITADTMGTIGSYSAK